MSANAVQLVQSIEQLLASDRIGRLEMKERLLDERLRELDDDPLTRRRVLAEQPTQPVASKGEAPMPTTTKLTAKRTTTPEIDWTDWKDDVIQVWREAAAEHDARWARLTLDPAIASVVSRLSWEVPAVKPLLDHRRNTFIRVVFDNLKTVAGKYSYTHQTVTLDHTLTSEPWPVLASILVHELSHAADPEPASVADFYDSEIRATAWQAYTYHTLSTSRWPDDLEHWPSPKGKMTAAARGMEQLVEDWQEGRLAAWVLTHAHYQTLYMGRKLISDPISVGGVVPPMEQKSSIDEKLDEIAATLERIPRVSA